MGEGRHKTDEVSFKLGLEREVKATQQECSGQREEMEARKFGP